MRLVLLLLASTAVHVPAAYACTCMATSPVEAARESGVAYVGEVREAAVTTCAGGEPGQMRVVVTEPILGVTEGEVFEIAFDTGSSAACGFGRRILPGETWILYGGEGHTVNLCSADAPWDEATEAALREAFPGAAP